VVVAQGPAVTAAAMMWMVTLGDFIRDITIQHSRRAIEGLLDDNIPYKARHNILAHRRFW
jgi:hypothetical protein